MDVNERVKTCRLIEKINNNPCYAYKITVGALNNSNQYISKTNLYHNTSENWKVENDGQLQLSKRVK